MQGWKKYKWGIAASATVLIIAGAFWWLHGMEPAQSVVSIGENESFSAVDCQARLFESSPALALMFSTPVDAKQNFDDRLSVVDLGAVPLNTQEKKAPNPPQPLASAGTDTSGKKVSSAWVVGDNPRILYFPYLQPQHRYRVTLKAALASHDKEALSEDMVCEVNAAPMPPAFYFASKGTVLPAKQNGGLPIVTVNVPEVDIQFLRVEPAQIPNFLERIAGKKKREAKDENTEEETDDEEDDYYYYRPRKPQGALSGYELDTLRQMSRSVYLGRFSGEAKPNRRAVTHIPVEDIRELQQPGIYIAVMSEPGHFGVEFQTTYFYVSDIGVHARRYPQSLETYATSLKTGKAISGVEFKLLDENGKNLGSASSDGDGHARFNIKTSRARVILAQKGEDFSLLSLIDPALDLSEFDTGGHLPRPVKIYAYAGRDLYRPGERADVSILLRDQDGQPLPPTIMTATLKRADGKTVQQFTLKPSDATPGFLNTDIRFPVDAQTGTWSLELRVDPASKTPDYSMKLQIEEFLPERMKLDLKTERAYLAPGDDFEVAVQGDYLYGAPAIGNEVRASVVTERQRIPFAQAWPGFEFGDFDDDDLKKRDEIDPGELDKSGSTILEVPVPPPAHSPMAVRAVVSLLESGGRPVVRNIERTLWPAEKMIGVRPLWSGQYVQSGAPAEFEVIRVTREGTFAPLTKATMRVYREDRDWYWVYDDQRGWHSGYNEEDELLESREFDLSKRTRLSFPTNYGRYRIEIADRETGQSLRYRFYVGWGAQDAELLGNRPDRVQLKLDKASYLPGETVRLSITPPNDGEALVMVEGDGALWQRRISVSAKGTEVEVPVGKSWNRHDLYISVVAFRPGSRREQVTPARSLGLIYLPINRDGRKLDIKLDVPPKTQPERDLKVHIKAAGLKNEKAIATVYAVDVGILNITRFVTPDAFDFFMGKQRYQPDTLDLYGKLIETMEGGKGRLAFGGDAALRETRNTPKKLKMVDLYSGPVQLNDQGEADITLKMPDFNGTLRVMATVASADKFGKAEAEVVSAAPVVAELNTPRFIVPGDRATIALDLTNMTTQAQELRVQVRAKGPFKLSGGAQTLTLQPQQKKTLRMNVEAEDVGGGEFEIEVNSKDKEIALKRRAPLNVLPLSAQEYARNFVRLMPGEQYKVDGTALGDFYPESALFSVTLSNTPPIDIASLVQGLLTYPYGCLEQTTSRAFPHLLIDEQTAKSFGLQSMPRDVREKEINGAISRLAGMQRGHGAFTLWGNGVDEPWLTAYVTDFLKTAREGGYSVPEDMLQRSQDWMLKQLQQAGSSFPALPVKQKDDAKPQDSISSDLNWLKSYENRALVVEGHRRFGALAYMGYVLSKDERAPLSSLRTLYDDYRDRARSPLPLIHLGIALKRMGDEKRGAAAIDAAMAMPYGIDTYWGEWMGDYGTRLRDIALSVALLDRHQIDHPRKETMRAELFSMLKQKNWLSTQEQLALLLAAKSFSGKSTGPWQAQLGIGGKTQTLQSASNEMRSLNTADVRRGTTIVNSGKEALYLSLQASGYPIKIRQAEADSPITLFHTLYQADGKPVGDRALQVGEQLLMHVEVLSKFRIEDGLVVDRVPAGLEIENLNFAQGNRLTDFKTPEKGTPKRWKYDYGYY